MAVYLATLAPSLTFEHAGSDGGDLVTAAWTLGVPHPTGYPFYTLLAWLFTRLPVGTIAYRANLLSATCAAGAAGLVCLASQRLVPRDLPVKPWWAGQALAAGSGLLLAFSPLFWSQAVISEVYALLSLLAALLLWLLVRWRDGGPDVCFWLAGLVLGLGLGNHLTLGFAAPAAAVLLWPQRRRWFRVRTLLPAGLLFLAGLGIYAYLPLAAAGRPPVNWGNPQTWRGFLWVVTARQYQGFAFGLDPAEIPARLGDWSLLAGKQFSWLGLPLALAGIGWWWQRERAFVLFAAAWSLPLGTYAFFYDTGDSYVYLLPVIMLLALFWAEGARHFLHLGRRWRPIWQRLLLLTILLLPLVSLAVNWSEMDLSDDDQVPAYIRQALSGVEPGSLIVVRGDRSTFSLWYGVYAERQREDVTLVNVPMMAFIWYRDHLRHLYPDLVVYEPSGDRAVTIDDLARELFTRNYARMPIYATDPRDEWKEWFDFVEVEGVPVYRVQPKTRWEDDPQAEPLP